MQGWGFSEIPKSLMDYNSDEKKRTGTNVENLSLDKIRLPRDLLQRFVSCGSRQNESEVVKREEEKEEEGDIELSLGLSLGGRFGVDKSSKKLRRSSSIAACLPIVRDDDALVPPSTGYHNLVRTSSLPVVTEEEWRKRKEMQTLRRMEAKRRRSEKQRISRGENESGSDRSGGGAGAGAGSGLEEGRRENEINWRVRLELLAAKRFGSSASLPFGLPALTAASRQASLECGIDLEIAKGKTSYVGGTGGCLGRLLSQGSMESQRGSSSSMTEFESEAPQGSSSGSDLSLASIKSLQDESNQIAGSSRTNTRELGTGTSGSDLQSPSKSTDTPRNQGKEVGRNAMEDMPCVFTVGDGPNAKRVDGILYKYGKGEEVRIMCVCHGSFLSPAEFVKHAGGNDVARPLKHIVINPNPPSF